MVEKKGEKTSNQCRKSLIISHLTQKLLQSECQIHEREISFTYRVVDWLPAHTLQSDQKIHHFSKTTLALQQKQENVITKDTLTS